MLPIRSALLLALLTAPVVAQERPTGIFCSCGLTTAAGGSSHTPAIAALPFVDGFLVRVRWADVEPAPGVHDWSLIEDQIAKIAADGKKIALAVVQGDSGTPTWLPGLGAQTVTYSFAGQQRTIALAWDAVYLDRWTQFVAALGARFAGEPTIELVHATHATHNGFEMQLPQGALSTYQGFGYSDALYAQSWAVTLDAFAAAFPDTWLDVDVHPVFGSDAPANQVIAHGLATIGARFGVFGAWWSVDNAFEAYPGMYSLFQSTAPETFAATQNVGTWVNSPERYDHDFAEYTQSYTLALETGVRYFEVWNADLLAASVAPLLTDVSAALACSGWSMLYGSGTPGAGGGVPALGVDGCPGVGETATVQVSDASPGGLGWLGVATERAELPLLGGTLWIGPLGSVTAIPLLTDGSGAWSVDWLVPAATPPTVTAQALLLEPLAPSGVAFSNALELRPN